MNKIELNEKWGKYCNTYKLVDDMSVLLKRYNHRHSEKGICALLDKYFTNKEPLIKLFITSKNYIGGLRIAVEKEFERTSSSNEVSKFFNNSAAKFYLHELVRYEDADGKTIFDYLTTGKNVFTIEDLPNAEQQAAKIKLIDRFDRVSHATIESVNNHKDIISYFSFFSGHPSSTLVRDFQVSLIRNAPLLKRGTKTSRAFNKVCTHYGIDKLHPETVTINEHGTAVEKTVYPYNKLFAEYSDLVSALTRKMHFVISLNPLDYFTMSFGVNWISCQNIEYGGCMGGTMSYMLDKVSFITFVVENLDGDIHNIPKVYRQMYHYENNLFMQNRLYPQGNDGATNLYDKFRQFVIDEFSGILDIEGDWAINVGSGACTAHVKSANGSMHYADYRHNRSCGIFYPENNEPRIANHVMTIGHAPICVNCGKEFSEHGRLNHSRATDCVR